MSVKIKTIKGQVCGEVIDGVYVRAVSGSKAFMRKFGGGIANSEHELKQAEIAGALKVRITDIDTGVMYYATIEHIRQAGHVIEFGSYGRQYLLPLHGWIKRTRGRELPPEAVQLPLFEGV